MAINVYSDDNKPHVLDRQRIINYAFITRKWFYQISYFSRYGLKWKKFDF